MTPELITLFCPSCGDERLAETPPCTDGHGADCPDRACVDCGTALMFDTSLFDTVLLDVGVVGRAADGDTVSSRARRSA